MASPVVGLNFDSLTPQQRFFISVATVWRAEVRDEALQTQIMTDVHSPAQVRGVLAEGRGLAMASLMARLDARGRWGGLLVPAFVFFFQKLYPFAWANDPGRSDTVRP